MLNIESDGVGLGFRPELAAHLLAGRLRPDFLELVAEGCLSPARLREAAALGQMWPLALHGVKLSLGSADGLDERRAARFARIARDIRAAVVTEHVSFVRAGGVEIGHLTTLPWTDEAIEVVARNAQRLQAMVDVPLLLENVAWTFRWPEDALSEGAFLSRVLDAAGCDMLLDVGNLYANARNAGRDVIAMLDELPLHRVRMLHVAGGIEEHGFYFDTHAHPVPDEVFALVEAVRARIGPLPVLLERDGALEQIDAIAAEMARLRPDRETRKTAAPVRPTAPAAGGDESRGITELAARQATLARLLTVDDGLPDATAAAGFDAAAIARTRGVLLRKRVDDALPLLPELGVRRTRIEAVALDALSRLPRGQQLQAFADAWAIARAAAGVAGLRAEAERDTLTLRARLVQRGGAMRPRRGPFVGRVRDAGEVMWVTKGFGAEADVHVWRGR